MFDTAIRFIIIFLIIFTPIFFGSVELWAFSLMELGILLIIILWAIHGFRKKSSELSSFFRFKHSRNDPMTQLPNDPLSASPIGIPQSAIRIPHSTFSIDPMTQLPNNSMTKVPSALSLEPIAHHPLPIANYPIPIVLLLLFLCFLLFQMLPLPSGVMKMISPKTYELRHHLDLSNLSLQSPIANQQSTISRVSSVQSPINNQQSSISGVSSLQSAIRIPHSAFSSYPVSFFPFATQVEFFKWLTLGALFFFLLRWKLLDHGYRITRQFILVILLMGVGESLYGMFEFFSGHRQILYLADSSLVSSVTGTFVNRNCFAGYLLMVIPVSVGYLFSREANRTVHFTGWRNRLSGLDGKSLLIGFSVIVMILGLLFSASRMGILSLLLSFTLMTLLFRDSRRGQKLSKTSVLIFTLAFLWAAWIGLDAVIGRFLSVSEDFGWRWMVWVNTFRIFKDFPLLGSGLGTFEQVFPMYQSLHEFGITDHAENDFLQMASDGGLIGIGLLSILFVILFYKAASGVRSLSHRDPQRYIGIGAAVGIIALMLHSLVETNLQIPSNAFLYTFLFAIILRGNKSDTKSLSH